MTKFLNYLNEDLKTDYLETSACIGSVISSSVMNKINSYIKNKNNELIPDIINEINSILSKNYDWIPRGVKEVKSKLNTDFIEVLSLIKGMNSFINDKVSKEFTDVYFIHDKITEYYKIEKEVFGSPEGSKENTADCILMNCNPNKLFSSIKNNKYEINEQKGFVEFDNGVKYFQVSLKKGKSSAQLGKVTKKLKSMGYDITPTNINEGKILNLFKNLSNKLLTKIKNFIKGFLSPFVNKWKKTFSSGITKKDLQELSVILSEGKINKSTQSLIDEILNNPEDLLNKINKQIDLLISKNNIIVNAKKLKSISEKSSNTAFKLVSNYKTVKLLNDMVKDSTSLEKQVQILISEMLFGGTKLPLWKVYGSLGSELSYEYLGVIDKFTIKTSVDIDLFKVDIKPQKSFYTITVYMLENIDEENKYYIKFRTGTNSSSKFTFIMEGTNIVKLKLNEQL